MVVIPYARPIKHRWRGRQHLSSSSANWCMIQPALKCADDLYYYWYCSNCNLMREEWKMWAALSFGRLESTTKSTLKSITAPLQLRQLVNTTTNSVECKEGRLIPHLINYARIQLGLRLRLRFRLLCLHRGADVLRLQLRLRHPSYVRTHRYFNVWPWIQIRLLFAPVTHRANMITGPTVILLLPWHWGRPCVSRLWAPSLYYCQEHWRRPYVSTLRASSPTNRDSDDDVRYGRIVILRTRLQRTGVLM